MEVNGSAASETGWTKEERGLTRIAPSVNPAENPDNESHHDLESSGCPLMA